MIYRVDFTAKLIGLKTHGKPRLRLTVASHSANVSPSNVKWISMSCRGKSFDALNFSFSGFSVTPTEKTIDASGPQSFLMSFRFLVVFSSQRFSVFSGPRFQ